jgi:Lon protease-like protein
MTPIFPLEIVLFPNSKYPLHIFEERYKIMVNQSIENDDPFGIVSSIDSKISNVGTLCRVYEVTKEYDNGSMDIIVEGEDRFFINYKEMHSSGYLTADIVEYNDEDYNIDFEKYNNTFGKFKSILNKTEIKLDQNYWHALESASHKSFKMAEKSGLDLKQRQKLLEMQNENQRLQYLQEHFERINTYLDRRSEIDDIVAGDGYINEI